MVFGPSPDSNGRERLYEAVALLGHGTMRSSPAVSGSWGALLGQALRLAGGCLVILADVVSALIPHSMVTCRTRAS